MKHMKARTTRFQKTYRYGRSAALLSLIAIFGVSSAAATAIMATGSKHSLRLNDVRTSFAYSSITPIGQVGQGQHITVTTPTTTLKSVEAHGMGTVTIPLLRGTESAQALSPNAVKQAYGLMGDSGGSGTIAIIDAEDDTTAEADLNTFSSMYNLAACTTANGCFTQYEDTSQGSVPTTTSDPTDGPVNQGETTLDIEWAHAIAPHAKILLIEEPSLQDLLYGLPYATQQPGVIAVSMSFGSAEFSQETSDDALFTSNNGQSIAFFAATGDCGYEPCGSSSAGPTYPAASPNVIGVGGTTLGLNYDGSVRTETGWGSQSGSSWTGSNGGVSLYETEPSYQSSYGVPMANGHRATPDVSLNADPNTGYPVYSSAVFTGHPEETGWMIAGGTSAATPIWAAIDANVHDITPAKLYQDATATPSDFRNITTGTNGPCGYYCSAHTGYNYITGLGVPTVSNL